MASRPRRWLTVVLGVVVLAMTPSHVTGALVSGRAITYVGAALDRTDFQALGIGTAGYWFPHFDGAEPVVGRPTGENAVDALPVWAGRGRGM